MRAHLGQGDSLRASAPEAENRRERPVLQRGPRCEVAEAALQEAKEAQNQVGHGGTLLEVWKSSLELAQAAEAVALQVPGPQAASPRPTPLPFLSRTVLAALRLVSVHLAKKAMDAASQCAQDSHNEAGGGTRLPYHSCLHSRRVTAWPDH